DIANIELVFTQNYNGQTVEARLSARSLPNISPSLYSMQNYQHLFNLSDLDAVRFFTQDSALINAEIIVTTLLGQRKPYRVENGTGLIPLKWYSSDRRFLGRDFEVGGDSWVKQSVENLLNGNIEALDGGDWSLYSSTLGIQY